MSYTTNFEGSFKTDRPLDAETYLELQDLKVPRKTGGDEIFWYVQEDRQTICDRGVENWRDYEEQLQFMVSWLLQRGYHVQGKVYYSGESITDCGTLVVNSNNKVDKYPAVFE